MTWRGVKATYSSSVGRLGRTSGPIFRLLVMLIAIWKFRRTAYLCEPAQYPKHDFQSPYHGPDVRDEDSSCPPSSMAWSGPAACCAVQCDRPLCASVSLETGSLSGVDLCPLHTSKDGEIGVKRSESGSSRTNGWCRAQQSSQGLKETGHAE